MRFNKAATLYFLLILFSIFCYGQETPPIQNYTAKEYGGENQRRTDAVQHQWRWSK